MSIADSAGISGGVTAIAVIGFGGFSRQCLSLIEQINAAGVSKPLHLVGCVDDYFDPSCPVQASALERLQVEFIGTLQTFIERFGTETHCVVAIADPSTRARITETLKGLGYPLHTLLHPNVHVHRTVQIGAGSVICEGVMIDLLVTLGESVHINSNCTIGHDATLGNYVTLSPLASIGGCTEVKDGAFVGANAAVLQNLVVGAKARVGAAACVVTNVADGVTVKGVPAK